jgi:hypothetical protein
MVLLYKDKPKTVSFGATKVNRKAFNAKIFLFLIECRFL